MGEMLHSMRELLAAALGHASLYGEAAALSLSELKVHWLRRMLWLAGGLLLMHTALIAAVCLGALSAWHQQWPSVWVWLLCAVPALLGAVALAYGLRQRAPRSLLAEVASEDAQWLRDLLEPPPVAQAGEEAVAPPLRAAAQEPAHERP